MRWPAGQVPGKRDLWLMNADGSNGRTLVEDIEPFKQNITWTPDGNWIVFGKGGQVWRVRRDGSNAAPITSDGGWEPSVGRVASSEQPTPVATETLIPTQTPRPTRTATPTTTPATPTPTATAVPWEGCGITINDRALYTSQLTVTLHSDAPDAAEMRLSNDGLLSGLPWQSYETTTTWQLRDPGRRVATLHVYAQFRDPAKAALCGGGNISDDIIYDPLPPSVQVGILALVSKAETASVQQSASSVDALIRIVADDQVASSSSNQPTGSGLDAVQVSTRSDFADAPWQPFDDTLRVSGKAGQTIYVRVRDEVGNVSRTISRTLARQTLFLPLNSR